MIFFWNDNTLSGLLEETDELPFPGGRCGLLQPGQPIDSGTPDNIHSRITS
jgi:hypothetical protein